MFPHRNVQKYTWISPDGKIHNQLERILIDRRWHLSILDIRIIRGTEYDTDHYLVVAKVTGRLAVSKQTAQTFNGERFYLSQPNELEVRKRYQIEITNRFASLENLTDVQDINRGWENIKENIKTSAK